MIDSRAIVDSNAKIEANVVIGPWTTIGADVEIGEGTVIASHVVVKGPTKIGKHNKIFQFSSIGEECQDKKYKGEPTRLEIGDHNVIREGCTLHRGTIQDQSLTKIGNHNLLMGYVHVAHDCILGDHIILANNASLAGHVIVDDWAIMGGFVGVHQFCRVGAHSMIGAASILLKDVPAYVMINGNPAVAYGINIEGLKRRDFSKQTLKALMSAYKIVYRQGLVVEDALKQIEPMVSETPELQLFIDSIKSSTRGIIR